MAEPVWGLGASSPLPYPKTPWILEGGRRERQRKMREMKRKRGLEEGEGDESLPLIPRYAPSNI